MELKKKNILFNTNIKESLENFCHIAENEPFDIIVKNDKYIINAKYILGILNLNLKEKVILEYQGPTNYADCFFAKIQPYVIFID